MLSLTTKQYSLRFSKQSLGRSLYFIHLLIFTGAILYITFAPLMILASLFSRNIQLGDLLSFVGYSVVPFVLFCIFYRYLLKTANIKLFRILLFVSCLAYETVLFSDLVLDSRTHGLVIIFLIYALIGSIVLTRVATDTILREKIDTFPLIFSTVALFIVGLIEWFTNSISQPYVPLGEALIKLTNYKIDLFFLDFGGYLSLAFGLISLLTLSLGVAISEKRNRSKKR